MKLYRDCPYCDGEGKERDAPEVDCRVCGGEGWIGDTDE